MRQLELMMTWYCCYWLQRSIDCVFSILPSSFNGLISVHNEYVKSAVVEGKELYTKCPNLFLFSIGLDPCIHPSTLSSLGQASSPHPSILLIYPSVGVGCKCTQGRVTLCSTDLRLLHFIEGGRAITASVNHCRSGIGYTTEPQAGEMMRLGPVRTCL